MRFLLKIGFWIALIAFFLPSQGEDAGQSGGVNAIGALLGTQQALSDASGFCERAPLACDAGRDVGSYVATRVGDGLAYGYAAVRSRTVESEPQVAAAPTPAVVTPVDPVNRAATAAPQPAAARPDPMQTAAVAAERVRRAADLKPFAMPALADGQDRIRKPAPALLVQAGQTRPVPTPTPRP